MYIRCNLLYRHNVFQIKLKWYSKCKKKPQQKYNNKNTEWKKWVYYLDILSFVPFTKVSLTCWKMFCMALSKLGTTMFWKASR